MCGICGILNFDGSPVSNELITAMTDTLGHRGPDGEGVEIVESLALGHRRLSIIDLSGGVQPMYTHDEKYLISFNGEIFNYIEVRAELEKNGAKFETQSDTEVLLEAYRAWGPEMLNRLNGQFAFALYSVADRQLFLARDRMGEKPLYYAKLNNTFVFASELKAILEYKNRLGLSLKISAKNFFDYLSLNYVPYLGTFYEEIEALEPGAFLTIKNGETTFRRYYVQCLEEEFVNPKAAIDEFEELLHQATKLRLRSDVPVGVFLSGGMDSSLTSWSLSQDTTALRAFIAHFPHESFSEAKMAEQVCKQLNIEAQICEINPLNENIPNLIEELVYHGDTPLADSSALPVYLLSRETAKHVKVVLSGDGGDELFAGYLTYQATELAKILGRGGRKALSYFSFLSALLPCSEKKVGFFEKLDRFLRNLHLSPAAAHFAWNGMFDLPDKTKLVHPDLLSQVKNLDTFKELAEYFHLYLENPTLKGLMLADQHGYLCQDILAKVDRMTMAHGLEARPVLMDPEIVHFANRLSHSLLLKGFKGKQFIRHFMKRKMPWYDLSQPKQGFSIPIHLWFRTVLKDFAEELFNSALVEESGLFNKAALLHVWNQHQKKQKNLGFELWGIMVSLLWMRRFA